MSEKVKVSRELVRAFNWLSDANNHNKMKIAKDWLEERKFFHHEQKELIDIDFDTLIALIYGNYEIEETPEEKILATYQRQRAWQETNDPYDRRAHTAYGNAIVFTLDTLGIEIEGINK